MLRVRREGRRYTQTIKSTNSGIFQRDEWETEVAGREPDLNQANSAVPGPLLSKKLRRRLKPLFEIRVRRTVYPVVDDERAIALAVDRGTIDTGTRSQKLCEIEIELERGTTCTPLITRFAPTDGAPYSVYGVNAQGGLSVSAA